MATTSRRTLRRDTSISVPSYSDVIRLSEHHKNLIKIITSPPTYLTVISKYEITTEEIQQVEDVQIHSMVIVSSPPLYSVLLLKDIETKYSKDIVSRVPSYKDFIGVYNVDESVRDSAVDSLKDSPAAATPLIAEKKSYSRLGLTLSVAASVLGWGSLAISVISSRYVEWYMFVGAILALILAVTGERLSRKSKSQFYVNTVVFSIFAAVFPFILLAIGWLEFH